MTFAQTRRVSAGVLVVLLTGAWAQAQPAKPQTATDFYKQYLAACAKATKVEDILPYWPTDRRKEVEATPAAKRLLRSRRAAGRRARWSSCRNEPLCLPCANPP